MSNHERAYDIAIPDGFLRVHELGDGDPVIVMHGGMGLDHTYMLPSVRALARDVRLILYDHRGNGQSSAAAPESLTLESWARDAISLADALEFDRFVLLGHSFGGFIALQLASMFGDRLSGLVLCSTAAALDYPDVAFANAQRRATPEQLAALTTGLTTPAESDAAFRELFLTVLPIYFASWSPECRAFFEHVRYDAAASNRGLLDILPRYNVRDRLSSIGTRALVVGGREDWLTSPSHATVPLAAALPNATLHLFERSGHFPFIEEANAFAVT